MTITDSDADLIETMAREIRDALHEHSGPVGAARAALAVARPAIWREAMEAAAKEADAEELTGDPPTDWNMDTIIAVQATVIATKCSIACAIRALSPPATEDAKP